MYAGIIIEFAKVNEIDKPFTYEVPKALEEKIKLWQRVKVPFGTGNKQAIGYVVKLIDEIEPTRFKVKAISKLIDEAPLINEEQIHLIQFMIQYYRTSYAAAISAVMPPGLGDKPLEEQLNCKKLLRLHEDYDKIEAYYLANINKKSFMKQRWIIDYLKTHDHVALDAFKKLAEVSESAIKTLLNKGILVIEEEILLSKLDPIQSTSFKVLNLSQREAVEQIKNLQEAQVYRTILLQGVTGSGKTEVFLHSIWYILEKGGSALVLVPEIALTPQTLSRFKERFGNRVALTHSHMTNKERQQIYIQAKLGKISIIIGPRSAVFMPLPHLKLIIIDEAHDASYKSDSSPKYDAIDIAKERMKYHKGQVILATATPSMESYYKAQEGRYDLIKLEERIGHSKMPEVEIVDMRVELAHGNHTVLSTSLYQAIEQTLKQDKQVMLLINRRGHSTFISCRACGFVMKCDHCDVALTYHAAKQNLQCHYCGKMTPVPTLCPECGSKYIRFFGSGTEKVEAYIEACFGQYGVGRMDADTTSGKDSYRKILEAFRNKAFKVLVGTQMIAKGHDFPDVTLVGILSADASLFTQDFRSNERTYQLLTQATGRAGRGADKGRVIIQTYNPDHFVMQVIQKNEQALFYEQELYNREVMGYPPYSHIFSILVVGKEEEEVIRTAHLLSQYFKYYCDKGKKHFRVFGPTSAIISKIEDAYRWRLLIIGEDREILLVYSMFCLDKFYNKEKLKDVKIQWDIDPQAII